MAMLPPLRSTKRRAGDAASMMPDDAASRTEALGATLSGGREPMHAMFRVGGP